MSSTSIVKLINYFYYALKEDDWFKEDSNVHFVMAQHESDIMCGSIVKRLNKYYHLKNDDITVYSTDSDLIIHSWPFQYVNLGKWYYLLYTDKFFKIFNEPHPEYLPV